MLLEKNLHDATKTLFFPSLYIILINVRMKTKTAFFLFALTLLGLSCSDSVKNTVTYMANVPVYMSRVEFRSSTKSSAARPLKNPGKICLYGNYIFINEVKEGIHVIDNSNPSAPRPLTFIEIIGNVDLAAKDGILYADNLVDMLLFDITDPGKPFLKSRMEGVFEGALPAPDNEYPVSKIDLDGKVVIGWEQKTVTEPIEIYNPYPCRGCYYDFALASNESRYSGSQKSVQPPGANMIGVNGSMSRFAISDDYLYTIHIRTYWTSYPGYSSYTYTTGELKIFSLKGATQVNSISVSNVVETLFAYGDYLFMGLSNGMQIFSIQNPTVPVYVSNSWHFWGCDPVVVSGDYAYLTVRSTNTCGQNGNLLQVIDISKIEQPRVVAQFPLQEPYGLGVDDNKLFVCDKGLKVFDATDPILVGSKQLFSTSDFKGFDLIPYNNLLLVIGEDGLYQYSYSSDNKLNRLSVIPVSK